MTAADLAVAALAWALAIVFASLASRLEDRAASLAAWIVCAVALGLAVYTTALCAGVRAG